MPNPKSTSFQTSVRVPLPLWTRVQEAMAYEGIRSFAQFNLSALTHHVRTIEERKAQKQKPAEK